MGTGVRNVYKYTKDYSGEDNIEFEEKDIFIAQVPLGNIFTDKSINIANDKLGDKLGDNRKAILALMQQKPGITISEIAKEMSISETAIQNHIKKLKHLNLVKRIGPDRGGYWEVVNKIYQK